jgi:hypothetical protein
MPVNVGSVGGCGVDAMAACSLALIAIQASLFYF